MTQYRALGYDAVACHTYVGTRVGLRQAIPFHPARDSNENYTSVFPLFS